MTENASRPGDTNATLPGTAPLVRLTAGVGSAGQKTWNVRRPVTLIGSRRPAHLALHDRDISAAHCVIVNTGTDVLLKDLHTNSGVLCNNQRIDGITVLKDGDVVTLGATKLQIAIRIPEDASDDSAYGVEFVEPTKFAKPLNIYLDHTETKWRIEDAVVLIGRHEQAEIRLDHEDISSRHAVLCKFVNGPALFDLGSRSGIWVNGERCNFAPIGSLERIKVGPCALSLAVLDPPTGLPEPPAPKADGQPEASSTDAKEPDPAAASNSIPSPSKDHSPEKPDRATQPPPASPAPNVSGVRDDRSPAEALAQVETELSTLQKNIADSWDRLNAWQSRLMEDATQLTHKESDLVAREAELDAKDAALRGQLHDLTRYHEQISAREQDLAVQLARIQAEQDELAAAQAPLADREAELDRRAEDLKRREHALAQRWTRLMAATCSHCGRPINVSKSGASDSSS
jgi:pSer/pThr/pTyr-binding forkhead associated (FHA) protein